jgi:phosphoribosyl 1,2-cyclic phosphodiesterase
MRIAVLGSGSSGNALAITSADSSILIDAGFGFPTLSGRAEAVGLDVHSVRALLLTHEHNDHAAGAATLAKRAKCQVYASPGTLAALKTPLTKARTTPLPVNGSMRVGPFDVATCQTSHDAAQPLALVIREHHTGASIGIAYDLGRPTAAIIGLLDKVSCLILEANHDDDLLRTGPYPPVLQDRIAGPRGHLSNRAAADLAVDLWHRELHTVVLAHLSERCNRPDLALAAVGEALERRGFRGRLLAASQDEPLESFEVGPTQYALDVFS